MLCRRISKSRIIRYISLLSKIAEFLNKDLDKADKKDIIALVGTIEHKDYSPWTKHLYRVGLKKFYRWLKNTDEYPDEVKLTKAEVKDLAERLGIEFILQ